MRQTTKNVSPMSNEGRNAYVIEHITAALLKLLQDKPMNDISISELCDLAGVGRASFYRNFECKEDVLKRYIGHVFSECDEEFKPNSGSSLHKLIEVVFTHLERHRSFYSLLNERGLVYLLRDVIIGLCGPKPEYPKAAAYAAAFAAYSLYGWVEVWFQRGMKESAEEMANLFKAQGL